MVDRRLIAQLDSLEPDKRKVAVQQLARSKDMDAIRYLEATERSDSDSSVRDLARKAIVYIKRQNEESGASSPASTPAEPQAPAGKSRYAAGSIMAEYANRQPEPYDEPMEPQEPVEAPKAKPVSVSESRQRNAKGAVDMAGRAAFNEDNGRAAKYLVEAFKQNPNLQFDPYAVGLAATVTGLYKTDAVQAILDGSALDLFDKNELQGKKKIVDPSKEADGVDVPPAGWGTALVDLFMYGLINAVIVGVTVIALIQVIVSVLSNDPTLKAQLAQSQLTLATVIDQVAAFAILSLVVYALVYGLMMMVALLIQSFLIHVAARMVLGGEGTMPNLIHRTALFLGFMAALITIVQIGGFFLPIVSDPAIGIAIWALGFFLSVYTLIGYSSRIGKAYDMGGGKGCAALFLSTVLIGLVSLACVIVLTQSGLVVISNLLSLTPVP